VFSIDYMPWDNELANDRHDVRNFGLGKGGGVK
jgi:hypothetical protein